MKKHLDINVLTTCADGLTLPLQIVTKLGMRFSTFYHEEEEKHKFAKMSII